MASLRDRLSKSFLERNKKVIGLIGILVVVAGSAFALLLTGGVFARTYPVTAYFTDAAGIRSGDKVTVAGLEAGTVKGMRVEHGVVAIDLAINRGIELPTETKAEIVVQTLLGKRAINLVAPRETLVASSSKGNSLEDAARIPVERTTTPVDIVELNDISVRLLDKSDAPALNQLMDEVANIAAGQADRVRTLISGLADLTQAVDERSAELKTLLDALRTLSTTLGDKSDTLVSIIDNLDPVLQDLADQQANIERLLQVTDSASHETADLVIRNRAVLDSTLKALHTDLQVVDGHQVDLAAIIAYLEDSVLGYQSVGYSTTVPNRWANIFVQSLGPLGIDAILGDCGAVDHLIDSMLGTHCADYTAGGGARSGAGTGGSTNGGRSGGSGGPGGLPGPGLPTPGLPDVGGSAPNFPGDIGDLIDSALRGWRPRG